MSIKKLFDRAKNNNYLSDTTTKEAFKDVESGRNVKAIKERQDTFTPHVGYGDPANFVKYGSAYLYYESAMDRVIDYYPYDGSDAELNEFYNKSLDIEKYIFDKKYPRTNGYAIVSADGWGTQSSISGGYGIPATTEHISFFGGPGTASVDASMAHMFPNPKNSKFQYSNIYDTDIYKTEGLPSDYGSGSRESNLMADFDRGVTVEFWLKTGSLGGNADTQKQVIFDMWNNEASSSAGYGRITIELTGGMRTSATLGWTESPFLLTVQSGTQGGPDGAKGIYQQKIGQGFTTASLNSWHHYAITIYNSGSDLISNLYVDGAINDTNPGRPSPAAAVDAIDTTGVKAALADTTFRFAIPTSIGGLSGVTIIALDASATTSPTAGASKIGIGFNDKTDAEIAALIIKAINGTAVTNVVFATSGNGQAGYDSGITATQGSSDTQITLTMNAAGVAGNSSVLVYLAGTSIIRDPGGNTVSTTAFTGGSGGATLGKDQKLGDLTPKNTAGRLGALLTQPSASYAGGDGAGKLSGSIDEFRYWKIRRTAAEIGKNWFTQVRGGANTDISNADLGVYYKFNEGITTTDSIDAVVLDYAGRICNGAWTGYGSNSRNTGSAIVSASAAATEYLDPIVRSTHPNVVSVKASLLDSGSYHDENNNASLLSMIPGWVIDEHDDADNSNLVKICHIAGAYLDKLYLQIASLPSLRNLNYVSASNNSYPFAQHLPQSLGLYTPEIFIDSSVMERFADRTEKFKFAEKLNDTKNLIYTNLYNNLTNIYKSKGTEKSIRNIFRCFYLDDELLRLNVYNNNEKYILSNNLQHTLINRKALNFNTGSNTEAVVYQRINSSNAESVGYIMGASPVGSQNKYGCSTEANIIFPHYSNIRDSITRNFITSSLFGLHTVNTASNSEKDGTTIDLSTSDSHANFQIYAVRDEPFSKNVKFVLKSALHPIPIPTLTSSVFFDVYDNSEWTISVKIKPNNYPYNSIVSGSTGSYYDLEFRGVNNSLGTIQNSFLLTASLTTTSGNNFIQAGKRFYCGAYRTDIIGAIQYRSDVKVDSLKYWTKYIDDMSTDQHAYDIDNAGVSGSYRNISALDPSINFVDATNFNTLALNWTFDKVTGSDSNGNFSVMDMSSGSATLRKHGWLGAMTGYQHTGYGYGFLADSAAVIERANVNAFKFIDPELAVSSDMVQILDDNEQLYGVDESIPSYYYVLEKSMYQAISEEMLTFFAGVVDFNNLIGEPVNRYRERYKGIEKLRQTFFEKVTTTATVEKFIEYYKWFDDALSDIIAQMIPASAKFLPDVTNTVESHVLERNKYKTKYPAFAYRDSLAEKESFPATTPDPSQASWGWGTVPRGTVPGPKGTIGGTSPVGESPRPTTKHLKFWKTKADPASPEITSGDAAVDAVRKIIKEVKYSTPILSSSTPKKFTKDGVEYIGNTYARRNLGKTYNLAASIDRDRLGKVKFLKGGTNFSENKNIHYTYAALYPAGPVNQEGGIFVPLNVLLAEVNDLEPIINNQDIAGTWASKKMKRTFKVQSGREWQSGSGYHNLKSSYVFPFNVMSSSVNSGYNKRVIERVTGNIEITNLHHDSYLIDMDIPMQGPYTDALVGGHQSRHISLNTGSDDWKSRPEAWKLLLGRCWGNPTSGAIGMVGADYPWPEANDGRLAPADRLQRPYPVTASQKAVYYRGLTAKRPVNIRNVLLVTGSDVLKNIGNYQKNYEVIQAGPASATPRRFVDKQPILPAVINTFVNNTAPSKSVDVVNNFSNLHRGEENHFDYELEYTPIQHTGSGNKSTIITRFAAPGGIEVKSRGFQTLRGSEFSVYNSILNRNLTVRKPQQAPSGTISEPVGAGPVNARVADIHNRDYGLISHLARHTARFGRDSLFQTGTLATPGLAVALQAPGASYTQFPGFHKVHRNNISRIEICNEEIEAYNANNISNDYALYFSHSSAPNFQKAKLKHTASFINSAGDNITGLTWTISAWIKIHDPGIANRKSIVTLGDNGGSTNADIALGFNISAAEKLELWMKNTSNIGKWTAAYAIPTSSWHHVAVAYDGGSVSNDPIFYVNGSQSATSEDVTPGAIAQSVNSVGSGVSYIGGTNYGNNVTHLPFQHASIDEVAIYDAVLSASEISDIYSSGKILNLSSSDLGAPRTSNLITWIRFGDAVYGDAGDPQADSLLTQSANYGPVFYDVMGNNNYTLHGTVNPTGLFMHDEEEGHPAVDVLSTATVLKLRELKGYCTSSLYDNFFVQHQIPRSTLQYSWLTSSVTASYNQYGFVPADFKVSRSIGIVDALDFTSASYNVSYYSFGSRSWGAAPNYLDSVAAKDQYIPVDFVGLNTIIREPISASGDNILGYSEMTWEARGYANGDYTSPHIGYVNYINHKVVDYVLDATAGGASGSGLGAVFNGLMLHRNGIGGWPMWKQLRHSYHPIVRNEVAKNIISIVTGSEKATSTISNHRLAPVSMRGRPTLINLYQTAEDSTPQNVTLKVSHNNDLIYFNDSSTDNLQGFNPSEVYTSFDQIVEIARDHPAYTINWVSYAENIFPSLRNEFLSGTRERLKYDNNFWRLTGSQRITIGMRESGSFKYNIHQLFSQVTSGPDFHQYHSVGRSCWPLDPPKGFLTRSGPHMVGKNGQHFGVHNLMVNGKAGELQNVHMSYFTGSDQFRSTVDSATAWQYGEYYGVRALWPAALYARKHMLAAPKSVVAPSGIDILETGSTTNINNNFTKHRGVEIYSGEAAWDAPETAGIVIQSASADGSLVSIFQSHSSAPWWPEYDSFKDELNTITKDYAIVPEFRISEHIHEYAKYGVLNKSLTNTFEVPGVSGTLNSSTSSFYTDYCNSDFMKNFLNIKQDTLLGAKEIKLTVSAAIRFNPYRGFYPAQRTVDLVSQLSSSFMSTWGGTWHNHTNVNLGIAALDPGEILSRKPGVIRPLLQAICAPGILYNSIKAGIAVDYPIVLEPDKISRNKFGGVGFIGNRMGYHGRTANIPLQLSDDNWALTPVTGADLQGEQIYPGGEWFDRRIPFEAMIEPNRYLKNTDFYDHEPHSSASLIVTASWKDAGSDSLYSMMASNFFGEVPGFFLEDDTFSKLESGIMTDDLRFTSGSVYGARVTLKRSTEGLKTYMNESGSTGDNDHFMPNGARAFSGSNFISGGWYPIPQDPQNAKAFVRSADSDAFTPFKETITMYSRPSAFGPPIAGRPPSMSFGTASTSYFHDISQASTCSLWMSASLSGVMDCFTGHNWAYTPPYYHGEAWADIVFKPDPAKTYDLEQILAECETKYWRVDPGPEISGTIPTLIYGGSGSMRASVGFRLIDRLTSGSDYNIWRPIYSGRNVNSNAMQISASFNLFGIERVLKQRKDKFGRAILAESDTAGKRWIIQPKFETPILNFGDTGVRPITASNGTLSTPLYGSASVSRGMWHQFGTIPDDPSVGITVSIGEIPRQWLKYHYDVISTGSIYNDHTVIGHGGKEVHLSMKSLSDLVGFPSNVPTKKLGQLKDELTIKEAVVAIPYIVESIEGKTSYRKTETDTSGKIMRQRKKFINIPTKRYKAALKDEYGSAEGDILTTAGESIRKLTQKMERYVLPPQFDFLNNKKVKPLVMYIFEFEYKFDKDDLSYIWQNLAPRNYRDITFQQQSIAHELMDTELLTESNLLDNENLRWMVFKVKQRRQAKYYDKIVPQVGESAGKEIFDLFATKEGYKFGFNWPYDYLSFVEKIKVDAEVLYKEDAEMLKTALTSAKAATKTGGSRPDVDTKKPLTRESVTAASTKAPTTKKGTSGGGTSY